MNRIGELHRRPAFAEARRLVRRQASVNEVVALLRADGWSKVESIAAMRDLYSLRMNDAKHMVHESPVWADRRAADDELLDALVAQLEHELTQQ